MAPAQREGEGDRLHRRDADLVDDGLPRRHHARVEVEKERHEARRGQADGDKVAERLAHVEDGTQDDEREEGLAAREAGAQDGAETEHDDRCAGEPEEQDGKRLSAGRERIAREDGHDAEGRCRDNHEEYTGPSGHGSEYSEGGGA